MISTESLKQQRMAARRALEWIGTLKARLVFIYEISDLFLLRFHTETVVHTQLVKSTAVSSDLSDFR